MEYTVTGEDLQNLNSYWTDSQQDLNWSSVFVLPTWQQVWWQVFGAGAEPFIRVIRQGKRIIGIAPLMIKEESALLIGDTDVCDYLDFVIAPGTEKEFFLALLDDLKNNNVRHLELTHVRSDSTVLRYLVPLAKDLNCEVSSSQEDISLEMDLPPVWDDYLESLSAKQRHEVRRKMRRFSEAGEVNYRFVDEVAAVPDTMGLFFKMFTESRRDKAEFMTGQMETFFRLLADRMVEINLLKLGVLELDTRPVAAIMCFDYNDCIYLYNSGYDPEYNYLSAGLLSKVLAIQDSIDKGRKRFDFLKGAEIYKYHLGGREIPLYRCQITIK